MGKSGKKVRIPRMTREKLISFLPDQFPEPEVFFVELTGVTYPDARYRIDREHSTVLCLEYVISGKGHVETGPRPFHPCAGSVYALPPGLHHRYYADAQDPWEKIWVNVRGSLCEELLRLYGFEQPVYAPDCPALPLFEELVAVCEAPPADRYVFERRCTLLVHEILLLVRGALRTSSAREPSPAERAKDLLDKSLSKPLSVEELAEEICLSPSQLTRVFRAAYGQTPYRYLLGRRLETACLLLRGTSLPVREIAAHLCFSDEHYFSSLFRQKIGVSPLAYRREPHRLA